MNEAERRAILRKHIFIVNGDPAFLDFVRELFQDHDYNVTTTNQLRAAYLQPDRGT